MYICSICLRHVALFKTWLVFINRSSVFAGWTRWKGNTYHLRYDALKCFICTHSSGEQSAFDGLQKTILLVYKLFEFSVEWIHAIRNKAEIIFSSKNHLHYCNCGWENNKCILCIWGIMLPMSVCCSSKIVSSAWLYFLLESTTKEKKS